MTINWTGIINNRTIKKATASTLWELYNNLVNAGTIRLEDYDPYEKAVIEKAGYKYGEFMDEWEEETDGNYTDEYFREKTEGVDLTDEELYKVIKDECAGNAKSQTFEDQDGHELRFDMNGNLRDLRSEKIWFSFDNKGNIGAHDAYYEDAEADAEANVEKYPDDEWIFDVQD